MSQVGSERQRETVDCGLGDWLQAVPPLHSDSAQLSSAPIALACY